MSVMDSGSAPFNRYVAKDFSGVGWVVDFSGKDGRDGPVIEVPVARLGIDDLRDRLQSIDTRRWGLHAVCEYILRLHSDDPSLCSIDPVMACETYYALISIKNPTPEMDEAYEVVKWFFNKDVTHQELRSRGFVYVMRAGDFHKIGWSKNPQKRRKTLNGNGPLKIELLFAYEVWECFKVEQEFHAEFDAKRHRGEWFSLGTDDVSRIEAVLRDLADTVGFNPHRYSDAVVQDSLLKMGLAS